MLSVLSRAMVAVSTVMAGDKALITVFMAAVTVVVAPAAGMASAASLATAWRIEAISSRPWKVWRRTPRTRRLSCSATQGVVPSSAVDFHSPRSPLGNWPLAPGPET